MPHISWLLPVLLCKDNSQLTAKKDLTIHVIFSLSSISRVYKLNKAKTTRFSSIVILWQVNILQITKLPKWSTKVLWPTIMAKVTNKKASRSIPTTTTIATPRARAPSSPAIAPWW